MTTENLGTLVAKFELDTAAANKAAGAAKSTLGDLERSTDKVASTTANAGNTYRQLAQKISPAVGAMNGLASAAGAASPKIGQLGASAVGLATTMATGGPLGLAIAGAGLAIAWLASQFVNAKKAAADYHNELMRKGVAAADSAASLAESTGQALRVAERGSAEAELMAVEDRIREKNEELRRLRASPLSEGAIIERYAKSQEEYERAKDNIIRKQKIEQAANAARELQIIEEAEAAYLAAMERVGEKKAKIVTDLNKKEVDAQSELWLRDAQFRREAHELELQFLEEEAERKKALALEQFERDEKLGKDIASEISRSLGLGPRGTQVAESFGEWKGAGVSNLRAAEGAAANLDAAGGVGLALELFKAGYDGIVQGFTAVAKKIGQFDSRMGGALGAAAPLAGAAVVTGGGLLTAPLAPALAGAAVATAFLELSKNTESYARTQATVQRAVDKVVNALEPFWQNVGQASGIMVKVAEVLAPAIAGFAGSTGELLGEGLFRIAQGLGAAISLSAAGVYKLGETSWTVVSSMQGAAAALLDLVPGMGDMAKTYRERAAASLSAANANEIAASEAMKTLDEILSAKYGEMLDPATQAVKDFTTALQDATYNIPTWYRAASAVSDRAPAQAGLNGAISLQVMRSRGYVSPSNWSGRG